MGTEVQDGEERIRKFEADLNKLFHRYSGKYYRELAKLPAAYQEEVERKYPTPDTPVRLFYYTY